ncbi:MAG: hypothetical protein IPK82_05515 [Polyangiaceae bacterium]|nr:hypothetical protein [Polyangiaceae bacterium]
MKDDAPDSETSDKKKSDTTRSRMEELKKDVDRVASGAALALEVAGIKTPTQPLGKKKLAVSGLLSFFLGPLGWLYAAPLKEAIPVIVVYLGVCWALNAILPFLLVYLLSIVHLASAVGGVLYAWGFNSAGKRVPLFLKEKDGGSSPVRKLLVKEK